MNFGSADAIVGLEKEFDVEGGVVLARHGGLGWTHCEFARLAGYTFGGYSSHGCQDRGDFFRRTPRQIVIRENPSVPEALFESTAYAVDFPEVVAGPSCAAGFGITTLRHLVLLLWQFGRQTGGRGERSSMALRPGGQFRTLLAGTRGTSSRGGKSHAG